MSFWHILQVVFFTCMIFYIAPMVIAAARHHRQVVAITVLNLLLGWTFVGWVLALVWSLTNESSSTIQSPPEKPQRPWPYEGKWWPTDWAEIKAERNAAHKGTDS